MSFHRRDLCLHDLRDVQHSSDFPDCGFLSRRGEGEMTNDVVAEVMMPLSQAGYASPLVYDHHQAFPTNADPYFVWQFREALEPTTFDLER